MDSPAQSLARYVKLIGERYMPSMKVNINFMEDRLGRGGDHTPFQQEGYAAVRLSTPNEIYANQHHATDTLENMSVPYTARVAKINAAAMASLGLSPKAPAVMRMPGPGAEMAMETAAARAAELPARRAADAGRGGRGGQNPQQAPAAARGPLPMVTRGAGYDAVLQWRPAGNEAAIKGYSDPDAPHHRAVLGTGNLRRQSEYLHAERRFGGRCTVRRKGGGQRWHGKHRIVLRLSAARQSNLRRYPDSVTRACTMMAG